MAKFILFSICCYLMAWQVKAESVDSLQTKRAVAKSVPGSNDFLGQGDGPFVLTIPRLPIDLSKQVPGAFKTGVVYQLPKPVPSSEVFWESVNDGYVARIHLVSKQAKRLRFHLVFKQMPSALVFRVQGSAASSPIISVDQSFINGNEIWLPITIGSEADLEIFIKGDKPKEGLFELDAVNVIVADMRSGGNRKMTEKQGLAGLLKPQFVGLAQEVEFDLACWNNARQYPALQIAASATALVSFIKEGGSYICTGTLLNDKKKSLKPWFITANHCISRQAVANTMAFEWFYQAPSCLSFDTDSRYSQTFGGARLLYANKSYDAAFLRLQTTPPDGVSYSGWNTGPLFVGKPVWGVHHPEGDHTMVSAGRITDTNLTVQGPDGFDRNVNKVIYSVGGAEIGSSGSGLFMVKNGLPYWIGGLYGGPVNNYRANYYTNFRNYFPKIQRWLGRQKKR